MTLADIEKTMIVKILIGRREEPVYTFTDLLTKFCKLDDGFRFQLVQPGDPAPHGKDIELLFQFLVSGLLDDLQVILGIHAPSTELRTLQKPLRFNHVKAVIVSKTSIEGIDLCLDMFKGLLIELCKLLFNLLLALLIPYRLELLVAFLPVLLVRHCPHHQARLPAPSSALPFPLSGL